jgi:peroxiredoxin
MLNRFLKITLFFVFILMINKSAIATSFNSDSLVLGQVVESFTLNNTVIGQPKTVSLNDYKDSKGVVVIFMTNGCYHCIQYRERIKSLHHNYKNKGFSVITVNPSDPSYAPEETFEEMQKSASKEKYEFPYLQDPDQALTRKYGVKYTPEAFVIVKKEKDWVVGYYGAIDDDLENKKSNKITFVENVINALLNNKKVPKYN